MPLNVCLIVHPYTARPDLGLGHDRYAYELSKRLPERSVTLDILQTGEHKSMMAALSAELKAVYLLAKDKKKRIYHATATANAQCAITTGKRPLVTTIHDVLWYFVGSKYDQPAKFVLKSLAIKRAARRSDAIIVPFPSTRDFLVQRFSIPEERLHVVHYGVDHSQFCPPKPNESLPRPPYMPKDAKIVLFVGAMTLGKGADTLIRSFDAVVSRVPDARLIIGSGGWDHAAIKELAEKSPVREKISFVGFIPEADLRAAYIHADVMAFPSRYGFGLSTLESMACGTPTVSGRTLDAPELIGEAGLMADPNEPEELSGHIISLLESETLHAEFSQKGLRRAADFHWNKTAAETAEIYSKLT